MSTVSLDKVDICPYCKGDEWITKRGYKEAQCVRCSYRTMHTPKSRLALSKQKVLIGPQEAIHVYNLGQGAIEVSVLDEQAAKLLRSHLIMELDNIQQERTISGLKEWLDSLSS